MIEEPWSHGNARENKVLGVLRRFIPGDYNTLAEIRHPQLKELAIGFDMSSSIMTAEGLLGTYLGDTLSSRSKMVVQVLKAQGSLVIGYDPKLGPPSGTSVFLIWSSDVPSYYVERLQLTGRVSSGFMVVRPILDTYVIMMQITILKEILKHGYNDN